MGEFIAKYWLEFAFGTIIAIMSFFCRKFYVLWQKEKEHQQTEVIENLRKEFQSALQEEKERVDTIIKQQTEISTNRDIDIETSLEQLKAGILSLQRREFIKDCEFYLQPNQVITFEVYNELSDEHRVYNSLGGNHEGDRIFELIQKKYEQTLQQ